MPLSVSVEEWDDGDVRSRRSAVTVSQQRQRQEEHGTESSLVFAETKTSSRDSDRSNSSISRGDSRSSRSDERDYYKEILQSAMGPKSVKSYEYLFLDDFQASLSLSTAAGTDPDTRRRTEAAGVSSVGVDSRVDSRVGARVGSRVDADFEEPAPHSDSPHRQHLAGTRPNADNGQHLNRQDDRNRSDDRNDNYSDDDDDDDDDNFTNLVSSASSHAEKDSAAPSSITMPASLQFGAHRRNPAPSNRNDLVPSGSRHRSTDNNSKASNSNNSSNNSKGNIDSTNDNALKRIGMLLSMPSEQRRSSRRSNDDDDDDDDDDEVSALVSVDQEDEQIQRIVLTTNTDKFLESSSSAIAPIVNDTDGNKPTPKKSNASASATDSSRSRFHDAGAENTNGDNDNSVHSRSIESKQPSTHSYSSLSRILFGNPNNIAGDLTNSTNASPTPSASSSPSTLPAPPTSANDDDGRIVESPDRSKSAGSLSYSRVSSTTSEHDVSPQIANDQAPDEPETTPRAQYPTQLRTPSVPSTAWTARLQQATEKNSQLGQQLDGCFSVGRERRMLRKQQLEDTTQMTSSSPAPTPSANELRKQELAEQNKRIEQLVQENTSIQQQMNRYKQQLDGEQQKLVDRERELQLQQQKLTVLQKQHGDDEQRWKWQSDIIGDKSKTHSSMPKTTDHDPTLTAGNTDELQGPSSGTVESNDSTTRTPDLELALELERERRMALQVRMVELQREIAELRRPRGVKATAEDETSIDCPMFSKAAANDRTGSDGSKPNNSAIYVELELCQAQVRELTSALNRAEQDMVDAEKSAQKWKDKYTEATIVNDDLERKLAKLESSNLHRYKEKEEECRLLQLRVAAVSRQQQQQQQQPEEQQPGEIMPDKKSGNGGAKEQSSIDSSSGRPFDEVDQDGSVDEAAIDCPLVSKAGIRTDVGANTAVQTASQPNNHSSRPALDANLRLSLAVESTAVSKSKQAAVSTTPMTSIMTASTPSKPSVNFADDFGVSPIHPTGQAFENHDLTMSMGMEMGIQPSGSFDVNSEDFDAYGNHRDDPDYRDGISKKESMDVEIDKLMEDIQHMTMERTQLLEDLQDAQCDGQPSSLQSKSDVCAGRSVDATRPLHAVQTDPPPQDRDQVLETEEAVVLGGHDRGHNNKESKLLDQTISLMESMIELVHCDKRGDSVASREASVLEQLEVLSDLLNETDQQASLDRISNILKGPSVLERKRREQREAGESISIDLPPSEDTQSSENSFDRSQLHAETSACSLGEHSDRSTTDDDQVVRGTVQLWEALAHELRAKIAFLERDRAEVVRLTNDVLEEERESNQLQLEAAVATARREARNDVHDFQRKTQAMLQKLYRSVCPQCRSRIHSSLT